MPAEIIQPKRQSRGKVAFSGQTFEMSEKRGREYHDMPKGNYTPQVITNQKNNPGEMKFAADGSQSITLA